jgi:DNA repair protein RecO (recombination protein O)
MNLVKLLTAEAQANKNIYNLIDAFFGILNLDNWIKEYIFWELELLKLLGYDLELNNIVEKEIINNKINYFVKSASEKKNVPNFLIDRNEEITDVKILLKGLNLVNDYLEKSILKPNNISYPSTRLHFVNLLK